LAIAAAVGLVLWANLGVIADVARLVGVPRPPALALSATAAFVGITRRAARRPVGDGGVLVGAAGVVLTVVVIGVTVAATPWTAWSRAASQPALTFGQPSAARREPQRTRWARRSRSSAARSPCSRLWARSHGAEPRPDLRFSWR